MKTANIRRPDLCTCLLILVSITVVMVSGFLSGWSVALNDFWGLWFYANNLDIQHTESLYNGFFPIGYAYILTLLSPKTVVIGAYAANALAYTAIVLTTFLVVSQFASRLTSAFVSIVICLAPDILVASTTIGPDLLTASFVSMSAFALLCYVSKPESVGLNRLWLCVNSGCLLGFSALFRNHSIIILPIFLVILVSIKSPAKHIFALFVGTVLIYSVNIWINVVSGHRPLESSQSYNVFKLVHGIDWYNPPSSVPSNILSIVSHSPKLFLTNYFSSLSSILPLSFPAIIGSMLLKGCVRRNICKGSAIVILLYAIPVSLGGSPRSWITIVIFTVVPVSLIVSSLLTRFVFEVNLKQLHHRQYTIAIAFILVVGAISGSKDFARELRDRRKSQLELASIRNVLSDHKLVDALDVFTDSFDIYVDRSKSILPRRNGGWMRYSTWKYSTIYPQYKFISVKSTYKEFKSTGVRFLVLSSNSGNVSSTLREVYACESHESREYFELLKDLGNYRVLKVMN